MSVEQLSNGRSALFKYHAPKLRKLPQQVSFSEYRINKNAGISR